MTHLPTDPKNIVVCMPTWLGDTVMATPFLFDLRRAYPSASITAMASANVSPLLLADPNIDTLYTYRKPSGWIPRQVTGEIVSALAAGHYDLGLLLSRSFSSAYWFWRANVQCRLGYAGNWRNWLLSNAIPLPPNYQSWHQVNLYKHLLEELDIVPSDTPPRLYVTEKEKEQAAQLLQRFGVKPGNIIVAINPGASFGSSKCWLPDRFREVTRKMVADPKVTVIYFGDHLQNPLITDICGGLSGNIVNLAGRTTLRELMALISQCDVMLTNESGPMHIAAALGVKLLALFGATSDARRGPFPQGEVINKRVACSPCYKAECPVDFRCMTEITSEEVYARLKALVDDSSSPKS